MVTDIKFINVSVDYRTGPLHSKNVLDNISLHIKPGTFTAVVGHTGAGKSSLLKTMNGLVIPKKGMVKIGDYSISNQPNQSLKNIRKRVGMVFQFPESQIFAETVEKDICFGPLNFGISPREAKEIARRVIKNVGLEPSCLHKSPFSLSGGEKRRVAIAGILAMNPEVLVLDEPGAGLDPAGKKEILSLLEKWNKKYRMTTIMVTHEMDDVARYADDVIVMEKGKIVFHGDVTSFFSDVERIKSWKLDLPETLKFQLELEQQTGIRLPEKCLTPEKLANALIEVGLV